jgi:hypothetical protein
MLEFEDDVGVQYLFSMSVAGSEEPRWLTPFDHVDPVTGDRMRSTIVRRGGRRYVGTMFNGRVIRYNFTDGRFEYQVRRNEMVVTEDLPQNALRLLDATG